MRLPFLMTVLLIASFVDARQSRIPNAIPAALIAAGLVLGVPDGGSGVARVLGGALLAGGLLLPFHVYGGMGAGDVKLMAGAGALLGPVAGLQAAAFTLLAGGLLAAAYVAARAWRARASVPVRWALVPDLARSRFGRERFPYAAAICAGTGLSLLVAGAPAGAG
jgi:prepilin peptidase CpaA